MGKPVVHFEIIGKDGPKLRAYYAELFDWKIDADNPMNYGMVAREDNLGTDGIGIGGGVAGYDDVQPIVTFYVEVDNVETSLAEAERLGGARAMGPMDVYEGLTIGHFSDPEGHVIGVMHTSAP